MECARPVLTVNACRPTEAQAVPVRSRLTIPPAVPTALVIMVLFAVVALVSRLQS
jgi:hypothetical protein